MTGRPLVRRGIDKYKEGGGRERVRHKAGGGVVGSRQKGYFGEEKCPSIKESQAQGLYKRVHTALPRVSTRLTRKG